MKTYLTHLYKYWRHRLGLCHKCQLGYTCYGGDNFKECGND